MEPFKTAGVYRGARKDEKKMGYDVHVLALRKKKDKDTRDVKKWRLKRV